MKSWKKYQMLTRIIFAVFVFASGLYYLKPSLELSFALFAFCAIFLVFYPIIACVVSLGIAIFGFFGVYQTGQLWFLIPGSLGITFALLFFPTSVKELDPAVNVEN